jgi:hypothetical protein
LYNIGPLPAVAALLVEQSTNSFKLVGLNPASPGTWKKLQKDQKFQNFIVIKLKKKFGPFPASFCIYFPAII